MRGSMIKHLLQIILGILTVVSAVVSIKNLFDKNELYNKTRDALIKNSRSKFRASTSAFFSVYKRVLKFIIGTFILGAAVVLIPEIFPDLTPDPDPTPSPTPRPTPTITITPTSTIYLGEPDEKLSDLDPIIPKPEAFYVNTWNLYKKIIVGDDPCPCSIGIRIPEEDLREYYKFHSRQRILHKESLEYSLGYKFENLVFNYGIDDSTFAGNDPSTPSGMCRIVMQYVPSNGFLKESDNIIFDSGWFNYHLTMRQGVVDLSNVETIRITASWVFDVDPAKDNFMNLAIVDPYLYYTES